MLPFGFLTMTILDTQGVGSDTGLGLEFEETLVGLVLP